MKKASLLFLIALSVAVFARLGPCDEEINAVPAVVRLAGNPVNAIAYTDLAQRSTNNAFELVGYPNVRNATYYSLADRITINNTAYEKGTVFLNKNGRWYVSATEPFVAMHYCKNTPSTGTRWTHTFWTNTNIRVTQDGKMLLGNWIAVGSGSVSDFLFKKYPNNPNVVEGPDNKFITLQKVTGNYSPGMYWYRPATVFNFKWNATNSSDWYWSANFYINAGLPYDTGVFFVKCPCNNTNVAQPTVTPTPSPNGPAPSETTPVQNNENMLIAIAAVVAALLVWVYASKMQTRRK